MKKSLQVLFLAALAAFLCSGCGSIVAMKSGSLTALKQARTLNVEYDYSGMRVGKFASDEEYVKKRMADLEAKEPGRGERWKKAWVADRLGRYQPKFESLLNQALSSRGAGLQAGAKPDAPYTLVLKTTFLDPGYNISISRRDALVSAEACVVETKNRLNQVAVITITRAPGRDAWGNDYDAAYRIQEAYAKAGKELGAFMAKQLK